MPSTWRTGRCWTVTKPEEAHAEEESPSTCRRGRCRSWKAKKWVIDFSRLHRYPPGFRLARHHRPAIDGQHRRHVAAAEQYPIASVSGCGIHLGVDRPDRTRSRLRDRQQPSVDTLRHFVNTQRDFHRGDDCQFSRWKTNLMSPSENTSAVPLGAISGSAVGGGTQELTSLSTTRPATIPLPTITRLSIF